jgi:hypothetical protein
MAYGAPIMRAAAQLQALPDNVRRTPRRAMNESRCLLEHCVEADVSVAFAWRFWTNVGNWDDPPAQFMLDGPFADGSRGTTVLPGQEPLRWCIRNVRPGRSATIEMELDRATLGFEWHFVSLADRKTKLTQRLVLSGENASTYAEHVRAAFGPNLPAGMARIAAAMVRAIDGTW